MARTHRAGAYEVETLVASASRTASGDSGNLLGFGAATDLRVQLDCTAASGTSPTLDVLVEDTLDGSNHNTVGTFAQLTASGREVIDIAGPFAPTLRVTWTLGGTSPDFTFGVVAAPKY